MIYNYFFSGDAMDYTSGTIPQLIQDYKDDHGISGDTPASAADFLEWSGKFRVPTDGRRLPKFDDEIIREIVKGRPRLCLFKAWTWEGNEPDLECTDGHWIVICGYLKTRSENTLLILDPDPLDVR